MQFLPGTLLTSMGILLSLQTCAGCRSKDPDANEEEREVEDEDEGVRRIRLSMQMVSNASPS